MSKASKLRDCPALGWGISSADCGEQRNSRLACPAACPHNPFNPAHYSQLLKLEGQLDEKILKRAARLAPDPLAMADDFARAEREGTLATHTFFAWQLYFAVDANQQTFARRWELSGWEDLRNDERVLMAGRKQMRIALVEIHRVRADGLMEAVDLLAPNPAPLLLLDRRVAARAARFSTVLIGIHPLPHFWRMSGAGVFIPDVAQLCAGEIVREVVAHLGGAVTEVEMRFWLAEHLPRVEKAFLAVYRARRQQMLAGIDAHWGVATYELHAAFAKCRDWLDEDPNVDFDKLSGPEMDEGFAEARIWVDRASMAKRLTAPGGQVVLGRILLGQAGWRLEALGAEKLSRLRSLFENRMGDRVRFTSERVDDLGGRMAAREPAADTALVPPRLLENPTQIIMGASRHAALAPNVPAKEVERLAREALDRAFLERAVPAFDNHTPREAARAPGLRPKLVQLMKQRVRLLDEFNLQTGGTGDLNWMLRELDLKEIIFDPPPWRPPPPPPEPTEPTDWPEPAGPGEAIEVDPNRPPAPPLPPEPFTAQEASARLVNAVDMFATAAEAEIELLTSGSTLLDDADELTLDLLSEHEFAFAISFLLNAWFAMVPRDCRAPEIDYARLERAFKANLRRFEAVARAATAEKLEKLFLDGAQPRLMLMLMSGFLETVAKTEADLRPELSAEPVILALLKSVVDELDGALRRGQGWRGG